MALSMVPTGEYELKLAAEVHAAIMHHPDLRLKSNKAKIIADFAAVQSRMEEASNTTKDVMATWSRLGYIDEDTQTCPDLNALLDTRRGGFKQEWLDCFKDNFTELHMEQEDTGRISEETWVRLCEKGVLPLDTDPWGEIVLRDGGIASENERRVVVLGHHCQRAERDAIKEKRAQAQRQKDAAGVAKVEAALEGNARAEVAICKAMGVPDPTQSPGRKCAAGAVEHFARASAPQLQDYISARMFPTGKPRGHKFPKKGKLADAQAAAAGNGPATLISQAFALAAAPVATRVPNLAQAQVPAALPAPAVARVSIAGNTRVDTQPRASALLMDKRWIDGVVQALFWSNDYAHDGFHTGDDHAPDGDRADVVAALAVARMQGQLEDRLSARPSLLNHPVWDFVRENLTRVVAIQELGGHYTRDARSAASGAQLLRLPRGQYIVSSSATGLVGSYLYHDDEEGKWKRAGKVLGATRDIPTRHSEHEESSKLLRDQDRSSSFYTTYQHASRKATGKSFADLSCYVGIGFMYDDVRVRDTLCDIRTGPFVWSKNTLDCISRCKFTSGAAAVPVYVKQMHMLAYLFEFVTGLMISPADNVSRSPGFESVIGVFGGAE